MSPARATVDRRQPRPPPARMVGVAGATVVAATTAVWRRQMLRRQSAWTPPAGRIVRAGPLSVRVSGAGSPVVLLHGLVGSSRFWGGTYDALARSHALLVPDLLGFGQSDKPDVDYSAAAHADALLRALDALDVEEPAVIAAHSVGCVVAVALAHAAPGRVRAIVGFGPPFYADVASARRHVGGSSPMARLFVLPGPAAERACRFVCAHRRVAERWSVRLNPSLPPAVAADAVHHTWPSYSRTLERCLLTAEPWASLRDCPAPVRLIAGSEDPVVDLGALQQAADASATVTVERWPGNHRLPLHSPRACAAAIVAAL